MPPMHGRGTPDQPKNRFERAAYVADPDALALPDLDADGQPAKRVALTQFIADSTRSILAHNESPDVPFEWSVNPYRGCEHGCAYCFARPTHEYLGYSAGLDFETKILVKHDAPELLRAALYDPKWQGQSIAFSGVTDCYQPIERKLRLTRGCLEVAADFLNPVTIVTKNHLVTRDIDVLAKLAAHQAAAVFVSVTTLDAGLTRSLEPRTTVPRDRLAAIRELSAAGIPVGVLVAPVIPGLTDHEMLPILEAAREAGAESAGFVPLRLPHGVKELFAAWLATHLPDRKAKVLHRVASMHGESLYNHQWGVRQTGTGVFAQEYAGMFELGVKKLGFNTRRTSPSSAAFRRPLKEGDQLALWGA